MIIAQANPRFETSWPADMQQRYMLAGLGFKSPETRRATGFDEFLAALEKETVALGKPVVYVHGDSHLFRVDKRAASERHRCKATPSALRPRAPARARRAPTGAGFRWSRRGLARVESGHDVFDVGLEH